MERIAETMEKNIVEVLQGKYIIPLYQRYFAWGEEQVNQLLQDIYESYQKDANSNYFIGSLVLLTRKDGHREVIDGQQRLTVLTILAKLFDKTRTSVRLEFDSRPEVRSFFEELYAMDVINGMNIKKDARIENYANVIEWARNTEFGESRKSFSQVLADAAFRYYFFHQVYLVVVEMPSDTDVSRYFEIMNNRGRQLQKHEILKARLLQKIPMAERWKYARLWDAVSQMDVYIQRSFSKEEQNSLFGDNYEEVRSVEDYEELLRGWGMEETEAKPLALDEILDSPTLVSENKEVKSYSSEENGLHSIIDFPNFLMHVFRLCYGEQYGIRKNGKELPLNEKDLLDVADVLDSDVDASKFILSLFRYRVLFDRYVVKQKERGKEEDSFEWILRKPRKSEDKQSVYYVRTFDEDIIRQETIIKALSMLQVTYRTRIYKRWLQEVLSWFKGINTLDAEVYLTRLNGYILRIYEEMHLSFDELSDYGEGTDTPHFLFNYIDYLYYCAALKGECTVKDIQKFDFRYRNSVEHHRPRSRQGEDGEVIDCLGNLCLVSKSANSRMNNEEPVGKAEAYWADDLSPKRRVMYLMTREQHAWHKEQIREHCRTVIELLHRSRELLS